MNQPMKCRRREKDRKRELSSEQLHARIDALAIDQHTRTKCERVEGLPIPSQRYFVRCAASDILVTSVRNSLPGQTLKVEQVEGFRCRTRSGFQRRAIVRSIFRACRFQQARSDQGTG